MNNEENKQLGIMDLLFFISFAIQLQNQQNIISIKDVQNEVDRAIDLLNSHLKEQDRKINLIMEALKIEDN